MAGGICDVHRFPFWLIYKDVPTVTIATAANLAWCPPLSFNSSLMSVHGIAVIYERVSHVKQKKRAQNLSCKAKSSRLSLRAQPIAVKQTPSHIAIIFSPTRSGKILATTGEVGVTERLCGSMCVGGGGEGSHWGKPPGISQWKGAFWAEEKKRKKKSRYCTCLWCQSNQKYCVTLWFWVIPIMSGCC